MGMYDDYNDSGNMYPYGGYSPQSSAVLRAVNALQGAKPSETASQIAQKALTPSETTMKWAGVPENIPLPAGAKYSPVANMTMKMANIDPTRINDRAVLGNAADMAMLGGAGTAADAVKFAKSSRVIELMRRFAGTELPKAIVNSGSWANAMKENIPNFILNMRQMAGDVEHPELAKAASDLVHKSINRIQTGLLEELKIRADASNYLKNALSKAGALSDKVNQAYKEIPKVFETPWIKENAQ